MSDTEIHASEDYNVDSMYSVQALKDTLINMFENEDCESGIDYPSEKLFEQALDVNQSYAVECAESIFLESFGKPSCSDNVVKLLHMLSHIDYNKNAVFSARIEDIAHAALSSDCDEVLEYAIKCYENWGTQSGIEALHNTVFKTLWVKEYAEAVISELSHVENS